MIWWLKARRWRWAVAVVILNVGILVVVGGEVLPVPSLLGGAASRVPAAIIAPLAAASALQYMRERARSSVERVAVRAIVWYDATFVLVFVALLGFGGGGAELAGAPLGLEAARNAVGFCGLGLAVAYFAGPRIGAITPTVYVVLAATINVERSGPAAYWHWPLQDGAALASWIVALAFGLAGCLAVVAASGR